MNKLIFITLLATLSASLANQELEVFAKQLIDLLNPHGANGQQNGLLLSLANGQHASMYNLLQNASHKLQVNVTFNGVIQVDVLKDADKVQVKHQFNGGAVVLEADSENHEDKFTEPSKDDWNKFNQLADILNKTQIAHKSLTANQTGVIVAHQGGAQMDVNVSQGAQRHNTKVGVIGGFAVGSVTTVNKN